jgi:hypothetical protein
MPVRPEKETLGGWQSFGTYGSGFNAGFSSLSTVSGQGDFQLQSGPGRLDSVLVVAVSGLYGGNVSPAFSGAAIVFYDGATPTSGGPYQASGHKILAVTDVPVSFGIPFNLLSGFPSTFTTNPQVFAAPFQSGLNVALRSGQPSFTAFWSAEPPSNF